MSIPDDYVERVYAGVLGKIIGVYLGRPFEGWDYQRIIEELGEIQYYVNERRDMPLIVTDDDISGTFTFLRAMPDHGNRHDLTPEHIGRTWLNYIIERRTILWWGGIGNSTEHTAYLRLKHGQTAPHSGSIATNGKIVAEQIGAQIFIDGWGMIAPGDPAFAADLARRAASVSHDCEAIYGAQVIAAMEAQAFVESDLNRLLDCGTSFIPKDSTIFHLIEQLREWHAEYPDWHTAREQVAAHYGYDRYPGNCHIVPNHALVIMALLYGEDSFQKSLTIVNTSGWDTDCNSGNVGCLLGIKNGLAGIDAGPDWRGPVSDRLYLSTADGGRAITDAVAETINVVNIGRALQEQPPIAPKNGARFHFELPGSVQGFQSHSPGLVLTNDVGHSEIGNRSLSFRYAAVEGEAVVRASTPVFIPPDARDLRGYELIACPTLYPGQTVRAVLTADSENKDPVKLRLYLTVYQLDDELGVVEGPEMELIPGETCDYAWRIGDMGGLPIASIGLQLSGARSSGTVYLDRLTWDGCPDVVFARPGERPRRSSHRPMWLRAWVNGVDQLEPWWPHAFDLIQNEGRGIAFQGTREWTDYVANAPVHVHIAVAGGLAVRVQGLRRYYALLLCADGKARLVKVLHDETTLAEVDFAMEADHTYNLKLEAVGTQLRGWIDDRMCFTVDDTDRPLAGGAVGLVSEYGRISAQTVSVRPVQG